MSGVSEAALAANKRVIVDYFAAWTAGDFDRVEQLVDPDGPWWTLRKEETTPIGAHVERHRVLHEEATDGLRFRVLSMTAEDDRVSAEVECIGDFGERGVYDQLFHHLFRVVDGRIAEIKSYYDTALTGRVFYGEGGGEPLPSHAAGV